MADKPTDVALEVYKNSILGKALWSTLDDHVKSGRLKPMEALEMVQAFGVCMYQFLSHLEGEHEITIQGDLKTYNLYDRIWKIELENAKIMREEHFKDVKGPLRFIATPYTEKSVKASDASLAKHDDNRHAAEAANDQLIPDVPKDKRYLKMYERPPKNTEAPEAPESSRPKKRGRKNNNDNNN